MKGFNGRFCLEVLDITELRSLAAAPKQLPDPTAFDAFHDEVCGKIQAGAGSLKELSYGRAAKLLNVWLKTLYLTVMGSEKLAGRAGTPSVAQLDAIHPPIDRVLLAALYSNKVGGPEMRDVWHLGQTPGWTKFDHSQYVKVISSIRAVTDGRLWQIEEYWEGHQ